MVHIHTHTAKQIDQLETLLKNGESADRSRGPSTDFRMSNPLRLDSATSSAPSLGDDDFTGSLAELDGEEGSSMPTLPGPRAASVTLVPIASIPGDTPGDTTPGPDLLPPPARRRRISVDTGIKERTAINLPGRRMSGIPTPREISKRDRDSLSGAPQARSKSRESRGLPRSQPGDVRAPSPTGAAASAARPRVPAGRAARTTSRREATSGGARSKFSFRPSSVSSPTDQDAAAKPKPSSPSKRDGRARSTNSGSDNYRTGLRPPTQLNLATRPC